MTAEPVRVGRRERRKVRARENLLNAAQRMIAENGIAGLRISDVTEDADVGFGTFYTYFDSKEALVEAVVEEILSGLASNIGAVAVASANPAKAAADAYRRFLRFASEKPQLACVLVELNRSDAAFEEAVRPWARETLEHGRASGQFVVDDVDLALVSVAAAALAAIRAILAGVVAPGPETESRGAAMMLRGLGFDSEQARIVSCQELPEISPSAPPGPHR